MRSPPSTSSAPSGSSFAPRPPAAPVRGPRGRPRPARRVGQHRHVFGPRPFLRPEDARGVGRDRSARRRTPSSAAGEAPASRARRRPWRCRRGRSRGGARAESAASSSPSPRLEAVSGSSRSRPARPITLAHSIATPPPGSRSTGTGRIRPNGSGAGTSSIAPPSPWCRHSRKPSPPSLSGSSRSPGAARCRAAASGLIVPLKAVGAIRFMRRG